MDTPLPLGAPTGGASRRLRSGTRQLRVHPWHGDPATVLLGPSRRVRRVDAATVDRAARRLAAEGVAHLVTPALHLADARPFLAAGFAPREELHLLRRSLRIETPEPDHPTRPGRRWHRELALGIDATAFDGFWRFDRTNLDEACRATPHHRFRLIGSDGPVGYAVTGRAGNRGYLQRLAVDPVAQGNGFGRALVADALTWLRRRGADEVMVNTQERNTRALGLYRSMGFVDEPHGLLVLERRLA